MAYLLRARVRRLVLDELEELKARTREIPAPDFVYRQEGVDIAPDAVVRDVLNRGKITIGPGAYVSEVVVEEGAELIVEEGAFVFDLYVHSGHKVCIRRNSTVRSANWAADVDFEGVAVGTSFTNSMKLTLRDAVVAYSSGALAFSTPVVARGLTMIRACVSADKGSDVLKLGDNLTLCKNRLDKLDFVAVFGEGLIVAASLNLTNWALSIHIGSASDLDIGNDVWISLGVHYATAHMRPARRMAAHVGDRSRIIGAYGTVSDMDVTLGQDSVYVDWHDDVASPAAYLTSGLSGAMHGRLVVAPGQICHKASGRPTLEYVANPGEPAMWW